jgi:hypothetical protein
MASIGKILRRLSKPIMSIQNILFIGRAWGIPNSHGPTTEHLLLIRSEKAGCRRRAKMEKMVLQAGDPGREHLEPFGRQKRQDGTLGGNAILHDVMST